MKKFMKKPLSLLMSLVVLLTIVTSCLVAFGDDLVAINSVNFPDANFREIVADFYDLNDDGLLSQSERNITTMSLSGIVDSDEQPIRNIRGIEFFPNIRILRIGGIGLEELNVSSLPNLTNLTCQGNRLTSLNVSLNGNITFLNCSDNNISDLVLGYNAKLTTFYCYANSITELEFSQMPNIEDLRCDQNELTSLDVSMLTKLSEFNCSSNHIPQLDLSRTSLTKVTDYMVGDQQIDVNAYVENDTIRIPFTEHRLTANNYTGCTLDVYDDGSGFLFDEFRAYDVEEIADGIEYTCSTGIQGAEDMTVHLNINRDFSQVDFFTNDTFTERIGKCFVQNGESATAPAVGVAPMCKAFDTWSDDFSNVSEDMKVYAVWKDAHAYTVTHFDTATDIATIVCADCDDSFTLPFALPTQDDDTNYSLYLDVYPDGHVNIKDYILLKNLH